MLLKKSLRKPAAEITHYKGLLLPGLVNAHCHLELSLFINKIERNTGLLSFLKEVSTLNREPEKDVVQEQAKIADAQMYANGISVVGDISNNMDTVETKIESPIAYHTFVECICISAENLSTRLSHYSNVAEEFSNRDLRSSLGLHAPYTCCPELYEAVSQKTSLLSIHNQESVEENIFFQNKSGPFVDFLKSFNFEKENILRSSSLNSSFLNSERLLEEVSEKIYVHNTFTSQNDIENASDNVWWCFCPKANLYIENSLPNLEIFKDQEDRLLIGTDSLASNNELNLLGELIVLQNKFPSISMERMFKWVTSNGARALSYDDQYGSFELGKTPGIVQIENFDCGSRKLLDTKVKRLF